MEARENIWKEKDHTKNYLSHINRDWWILKGQLILGGILLAGIAFYLLLGDLS
ncbi:hypothetical protein LZ575_06115 [Antarcticibacterium sp. 1MA-6-2]|uniref:hypothetical protein n=1 Tax=Antarcticibacterium sp. 1MA-6-2 TaxID=2908210 RepID=UPI001F2AC7D3|nr:hypothetical protein [Antarcticibacterium sp. 1MA-6-2]UJH92152.1 hypothetical protein LZ575_06115 [Antarcticibacterium sp. 1MA-6-2]